MAKAAGKSKELESSGTSLAERLDAALAKVDRPGTFCASGSVPAVLPGLEIEGVGPVGLPLTSAQLKVLKRRFEQAPYGKGRETLVDTKVRRVLRMTPDRFKLTNPDWAAFLAGAVAKVEGDLGLEDQKLEAHLYDLLLYQPGDFFLPHQDGEKLDRMVATLVVVLPSKFEGGELIVRHEGQEQRVDFSGPDSMFRVQYAAFYADCEHEVRPLKSGYRLCVIYNLTLAKLKKALGAPRSGEPIAEVAEILRGWNDDPDAPAKLAVTMSHEYTQDGLSWDSLKGVDRSRALVLAEAARQADCHAYLALLTFYEMGSAEGGYEEYGYGRRYGGDWDDGEGDEGSHEMGEVIESSLTAENWRSPDGKPVPFGEMPVEEDEVVPPESLKEVEPEEDFEGYTGNAGMTLERWYRHAAIFLWPDERQVDVILQSGSRSALPALERMVLSWEAAKGPEADALRARCAKFAGKILAKWPTNEHRSDYAVWTRADSPDPMASLSRLDDPDLIRTYLCDTLVKDASLEAGKETAKAVTRHGWAAYGRELRKLFHSTTAATIERNVRLLEKLCPATAAAARGKKGDPDAREITRHLAEEVVSALERVDSKGRPEAWQARRIDRPRFLASLTRAMVSGGFDDLLSKVLDHVRNTPETHELRAFHLPTLTQLAPWLKKNLEHTPPALSRWVATTREQLESLTEAEPQPPADFRRDANLGCNCLDCAHLKRFLVDPNLEVGHFQMAQHRRSHLEDNLRKCKCDVTCKTDTRPRPQVLVCTKTSASYERRLKQYHEDLQQLAAVRSIEAGLPA